MTELTSSVVIPLKIGRSTTCLAKYSAFGYSPS